MKPDARTPPSPYLSHIPERDVTTLDGLKLTLMNPAYMMRQMTEEFEQTYGIKGKITGKTLLNPINTADEWELKALTLFEQGKKEIVEEQLINGQPFVRLMKPMMMTKGCEKCHGHLGFREGDLRGGVSVSIPMKPYLKAAQLMVHSMIITYSVIWLLGVFGLIIYGLLARKRDIERVHLQHALAQHQVLLEERIEQRTHELKEKEIALLDSQTRAHHSNKMASLGEMASGIAHDINSPLQVISLLTFKLKRQLNASSLNQAQHTIDKIDTTVLKISHIIDSFRKMSRDSSNDPFEHVVVEEIINNVTVLTLERFESSSIDFKLIYHKHCETSILNCQQLQVGRILVNLINNAFDAVKLLSEKWIKLEVIDKDKYILFAVIDSGEGVSHEHEERIFEPMYTTKSINEGTGLGLSLSLEIARFHKGTLSLDKDSHHTCFKLILPKEPGNL